MKYKVKQTIEKYNMLKKGDSVTVGLSGGADSVCLTLILNELKKDYDITLKAVHINHMLRGKEADDDMEFCKDFCRKIGIELETFKVDVKKIAAVEKKGFEECAREIRYKYFAQVSSGGKVATAHNLDDVAETMLFNIARGCSQNGLCSIPAKRDNIIRPLIEISRQEIEDYLNKKGQDYVTDSTNLSDEYTRNKIRHSVIPILKEINPKFLQSVSRIKENSQRIEEYLNGISEKLISDGASLKEVKECDDAVIYQFVYDFVKHKTGIKLDNFHIEKCVEIIKNGGKCQLPKNNFFYIYNEYICVGKIDEIADEDFEIEFSDIVKTPYNTYISKIIPYDEFKNNKNVYNLFLNNTIDYDKICDSLKLRNRRPGDKIRLKNRRINKEIRTIYNEKKILPFVRSKLAVLSYENGKIIWAENIGVADEFCPDNNTKTVLLISREVDYN